MNDTKRSKSRKTARKVAHVPAVPANLAGNTKPSSHPCIRWCFTLHGYSEEDIEILKSMSCSDVPVFKYCVFSEELGGSGETPHLQGYFELFKKKRYNELGLREQYHFECTKSDRERNIEYISKEGGKCYINGRIVRRKQYLKKEQLYKWQKKVVKLCDDISDEDRFIYWFYDEKGCSGKSKLANYIVKNYNALVVSGKISDVFNGVVNWKKNLGIFPDIIIYDIPRSFDLEYLNYTAIEKLKDGLFFSGKYESGMVDMPYPLIIIFSNEKPELNKMSQDRWKVDNIATAVAGVCEVVSHKGLTTST